MRLNIEITSDGSPTFYREDIDEHYHSVKGALAESRHIYLQLGWSHIAQRQPTVRVFEVGFGTGLNAALTAKYAQEHRVETTYYAIELFPIPAQMNNIMTDMQSEDHKIEFIRVNAALWNEPVDINPYFHLHKISGDLHTADLPDNVDVIYFDAFAPEKQPDIWDVTVFQKLYRSLASDGILVTYCAKGAIRRMLQSIGFRTERLPGPPGGKREVLRAIKCQTEISI